MRLIATLFLVGACAAAIAKPVGVAKGPTGTVVFYDERGMCVGDARRAEYVERDKPAIPGCYTAQGPFLLVVFMDGDIARVPMQAVEPPKEI